MCFELFRCIPLKVDWSFNSPRASQGPPKGLPRASQGPPCLSIQTKLSAQSSEPQGLRTLHHTELYSWLPRSHGALITLIAETSMWKVHQSLWHDVRSVSVIISVISGHDVFTNFCWKAYIRVSAWYFVSDSVAGLRCVILRCVWDSLACSMCSCKGRISSY